MAASHASLLTRPDWYRALTLTERLTRPGQAAGRRAPARRDLAERAARRLGRWRSQPAFAEEGAFARRLATAGLTEETLQALLAEPAEVLRDRLATEPEWLRDLAAAFSSPEDRTARHYLAPVESLSGLLGGVEPVIALARDRLRDGASRLAACTPDAPFDPEAIDAILLPSLAGRLGELLMPTLVLELHVARLEGRLDGETPEARFQSFLDQLRPRDAALALLREYPVLARLVSACAADWVRFGLAFLEHLCADADALRATLAGGRAVGRLRSVDAGSGDRHRGGRSVLIARFDSGFRAVYKPKSLAAERHFQALLAWVNARGADSPFRTLALIDRDDHGWVEFVEARPCVTPDEVERFYRRQGGYLALLHVLAATDLHFENLIAAGEHPVLVDVEALFHPPLPQAGDGQDDPALQAVEHSVLRNGLLPREWGQASATYDLSGLMAPDAQLTPFTVPVLSDAGSDAMRVVRQQVRVGGGRHRPTLAGAAIDARAHRDALVSGFTAIYRLLARHRRDLLAPHGPLAAFASDEVRVIPRATQEYGSLLQVSLHPDVLRDALDRDRLLDHLWGAVRWAPALARIVAAEQRDLTAGDLPIFTTRPGSRDLWTSRGERIPAFFDEPGLALAERRLVGLGTRDLERQIWFIDNALGARPRPAAGVARASRLTSGGSEREGRAMLLARAAGDRLTTLAVEGEHGANWVGLAQQGPSVWVPAALGLDLYDGLPGVVLFLAYLGAVSGEERYAALARSGLATLRRELARARESRALTSIGGFAGWGGLIYSLAHLGVVLSDPALLAEAEGLVGYFRGLIHDDDQHDVIAGAAGCIGGLLSLYHRTRSPLALQAAVECGDHLIACARPSARGAAWLTGDPPRPLTGFAHGAAGVAWALLVLAAQTGAPRFRSAAAAAIDYERGLFSPEHGNWPDLREHAARAAAAAGAPAFMTAWCHGAPGIGLARLHALRLRPDPVLRREVEVALRTTLAEGFGMNHSLCHGDLGNLDVLVQGSRALADAAVQADVERATARVLASIAADGWRCGNPRWLESPGLMTGIAGIGYGLLRLAAPDRVPCVLTLAPPR